MTAGSSIDAAGQAGPVKVLFVCLGNICRSPTAHGVFETLVRRRGLGEHIQVDSCGTGDWHIGHPPDRRAQAAARRRGYALEHLRARQVVSGDFERFDYILAMDRKNLAELRALAPTAFAGHLGLFLDAGGKSNSEVPDPYYGDDDGFDHVLDLVEQASDALLEQILAAR
ncbi:MAG: low molecular weight protein-tyrosine-phosphatase [Parahaliea sp.]